MLKKWLQRVLGIEDIKELIFLQNNSILAHDKASTKLMRSYEKSNIELTKELENAQKLLKEKEAELTNISATCNGYYLEIQRLSKTIEKNNIFQEKVEQHLETVAMIAKNVHKSRLEKNMSAIAYERNNMTNETKVKLK